MLTEKDLDQFWKSSQCPFAISRGARAFIAVIENGAVNYIIHAR